MLYIQFGSVVSACINMNIKVHILILILMQNRKEERKLGLVIREAAYKVFIHSVSLSERKKRGK